VGSPTRGWATLGAGTADQANHASRLRPVWPPHALGLRKGTDVASSTPALPSALRTGAQFRGWVARSATADPDTVEDLRILRRRSAAATQPTSRSMHRHLRWLEHNLCRAMHLELSGIRTAVWAQQLSAPRGCTPSTTLIRLRVAAISCTHNQDRTLRRRRIQVPWFHHWKWWSVSIRRYTSAKQLNPR